ncbi:MAG: HlyD family efflux transporter periplasmic adaptor subunit [Acidobacteriota bacterium]
MPSPFAHTLRSLEHGPKTGRWAALGLVLLLLAAWMVWFLSAPVGVHATSRDARLVTEGRPHAVAAPVAGRVAGVTAELGQSVAAGDVLMTLDGEQTRRLLEAEPARLAGAEQSLLAVERQIEAEGASLAQLRRAAAAAGGESASKLEEAQEARKVAEAEVRRLRPLVEQGIAAEAELERAEGEAARLAAAERSQERGGTRVGGEFGSAAAQSRSTIEELGVQAAGLRSTAAGARAEIARLEDELGRHLVTAPVAGTLAQLADLRPGAAVAVGDTVATVVPEGQLRIVADFDPGAAVGRIRPGQDARMRFDGFPWTQFGTLRAVAVRVGSEPSDDAVRVELLPKDGGAPPSIPLQSGLRGEVEVEVETTTPAALVLRAAGRTLRPAG